MRPPPSVRLAVTLSSLLAVSLLTSTVLGADVRTADVKQASETILRPASALSRAATTSRTNIVVVLIDDMPEVGTEIFERLPTIDQVFVRQGLRFTDAHASNPLSTPSRAGLLTGRSSINNGVSKNDPRALDPSVTIATELQARGYWTQTSGKYLNGPKPPRTPRGWDRYAYTPNAYYDYKERLPGGRVVRRGTRPQDYQPFTAFGRAVDWIGRAPRNKPIFALVTPYAVHAGKNPKQASWPERQPVPPGRYVHDVLCADIEPWLTPAHTKDTSGRLASQADWRQDIDGYDLRRTCETMLAIDKGVRDIRDELARQGRLDDTLFVLTADNGMGWGAHGRYGKGVNFTTAVPMFVSWPAGRGSKPAVEDDYVSLLDLAPTFCAIAGCEMGPFRRGPRTADGSSILGVIKGNKTIVREALFAQGGTVNQWLSVRTTPDYEHGEWHYTRYAGGEVELYDASGGACHDWQRGDRGDPCELTNLAGQTAFADIEQGLLGLARLGKSTGGHAAPFLGSLVDA